MISRRVDMELLATVLAAALPMASSARSGLRAADQVSVTAMHWLPIEAAQLGMRRKVRDQRIRQAERSQRNERVRERTRLPSPASRMLPVPQKMFRFRPSAPNLPSALSRHGVTAERATLSSTSPAMIPSTL